MPRIVFEDQGACGAGDHGAVLVLMTGQDTAALIAGASLDQAAVAVSVPAVSPSPNGAEGNAAQPIGKDVAGGVRVEAGIILASAERITCELGTVAATVLTKRRGLGALIRRGASKVAVGRNRDLSGDAARETASDHQDRDA